jgi:hypothetical protein
MFLAELATLNTLLARYVLRSTGVDDRPPPRFRPTTSGCWQNASGLLRMGFGIVRVVANENVTGDPVSKVVFFLLTTIPYQGFFIWAAYWLTLDEVHKRRSARSAALAARWVARREP